MSVRQVERRICDRPGCDNTVTKHGTQGAGLTIEGGVSEITIDNTNPGAEQTPPDLCRDCTESLITWWTGKENRLVAKAERERESEVSPS